MARRRTAARGQAYGNSGRVADIQNGGVIRMSEMSSMLCIMLYREAFSYNEPK